MSTTESPAIPQEDQQQPELANPHIQAAVDAYQLSLATGVKPESTYNGRPVSFASDNSSIEALGVGSEIRSAVDGIGKGKVYYADAALIGDSDENAYGFNINGGNDQKLRDTWPSTVEVEGRGVVTELTGKNAARASDIIHARAAREVGDIAVQTAKNKIDQLQRGIGKLEK